MSTLEAKRRRTNNAATALSRPFRSPFKAASSADGDPQRQRAGFATPEPNCSPSRYHGLSLAGTKATSVFQDSRDPHLYLSLKSGDTSSTQFEIEPTLKAQRQLEDRLRKLIEELDVAEQAHKIENDSLKNKYRGEEVDGELRDLAQRWKMASRQAAEELFGGVKDRINRMGGPRAWKEIQQRQQEFQSGFSDEPLDAGPRNREEDNEAIDVYAECGIEPETENEREARGGNDIAEEVDEDEFTMPMMLRTLNIELSVIGYDKGFQQWID